MVDRAYGTIEPDLVVHLAARAGVRPSIQNPVLYQDVNVGGTQILLEAARRHGTRRFLFASSSSVYGENPSLPKVETMLAAPVSPYAVSKLAGENLAKAYCTEFGLPTGTIRPFNIYGPGQTGEGAIQIFIKRALKNEDIFVRGDGTQIRAWCYIDDLVHGSC